MAEDAFEYTPYRFAFNNSIFFSDPIGLWERTDGEVTPPTLRVKFTSYELSYTGWRLESLPKII